MAITSQENPTSPGPKSTRSARWATGTNVAVASILAVALVGVLQWGGYTFNAKADLTTSGINSLSEGTEKLLDSLDAEVRITSLYFESDLEPQDQAKFRGAVADLIELYRMANPGEVATAYVNPLQDHQKRKDLLHRLQQIPKFAEQAAPYRALLDTFEESVTPKIAELLSAEQDVLSGLTATLAEGSEGKVLGAIANYFKERQLDLTDVQEQIRSARQGEVVDFSGAWAALKALYNSISRIPQTLDGFAAENATALRDLDPSVIKYLEEAADRYRPLAEEADRELEKGKDIGQLEFDRIARQFSPTCNCILVDTQEDARIITFGETWPPMQGGATGPGDSFSSREFRGEEKISSAILQITQPEKPAVVFVRYGGPPLFFGGFRPGMPRAPYMQMKEHLESINFSVHEWDLASSTAPPVIDPPPSRVIHVVLKPTAPPMGAQPPQSPPFGEEHRKALLDALGEDGRAVFIAGWHPSEYGPIPNPYEYGDYLKETWGIDVIDDVLVIQTIPVGPNEFRLARGFQTMTRAVASDHLIVQGLGTRRSAFPLVAPLHVAGQPPEDVQTETLLWFQAHDGRWGVRDIQQRMQEQQKTGYVPKEPDDMLGPFNLAVSAQRGDAKVVVVSSPFFAIDEVAFATQMILTAQGLGMVNANPGNVTLFVNALHWLADNTQWMNLGRPIESRVIEIEEGASLTFVRVLVWGIWPAMTLVFGGVVWIVRRR